MEYYIIIAASVIIVLSYLFNIISDRFNVPAVLLLIILGVLGQELISVFGVERASIQALFGQIKLLEVLGTLGLLLIVLEAALELKITKDKVGLIAKAFVIALVGLITSILCIGVIFYYAFGMEWWGALIYATPLSILSSAIVIPSVVKLPEEDAEFHIYESTFSDILGIMAFYLLIELAKPSENHLAFSDFSVNLLATIVTSIVLSYVLIYVFQKMETKVKLFLMIAVLLLLFATGKLLHLSSLLVILIFGLVLNNYKVFFFGSLRKLINTDAIRTIHETFLMITIESAFVVRTFFFVIFGFSISLATLLDFRVALVSLAVLTLIYATRYVLVLPFRSQSTKRTVMIAPRGLITLLLFYSIPEAFIQPSFKAGVLLFVIIITSLVMTKGLFQKTAEGDGADDPEGAGARLEPDSVLLSQDGEEEND